MLPYTVFFRVGSGEVEEELLCVVRVEKRVQIGSDIEAERCDFLFFGSVLSQSTFLTVYCHDISEKKVLSLHDQVFYVDFTNIHSRLREEGSDGN